MAQRTQAQREADLRYRPKQEARYSTMCCRLLNEEAEAFRAKCAALGTTPNKVFREAIAEIMKK